MKRIHNLILSLVVLVGLGLPAAATLTNSSTFENHGDVRLYNAAITAASNDTTANADSNVLLNQDGSIDDICAGVTATNKTGTSPTLTVSFLGSHDGTVFFAIRTAQGGTAGTVGAMASPALDISSADSTNVSTGVCASQFGLKGALLPPYLKVRIAVGGSSTPGWTGVARVSVRRKP